MGLDFFGTNSKAEPRIPISIVPKVEHKSPLTTIPKMENQPIPPPIVAEYGEPKSNKKFRCGICSSVFNSKCLLEAHWKSDCKLVNNQMEGPTYRCGECRFQTKTVDEMKYHWRVRCTRFASKTNETIKKPVKSQTMSQKENLRTRNLLNNIHCLIENGTVKAGRMLTVKE